MGRLALCLTSNTMTVPSWQPTASRELWTGWKSRHITCSSSVVVVRKHEARDSKYNVAHIKKDQGGRISPFTTAKNNTTLLPSGLSQTIRDDALKGFRSARHGYFCGGVYHGVFLQPSRFGLCHRIISPSKPLTPHEVQTYIILRRGSVIWGRTYYCVACTHSRQSSTSRKMLGDFFRTILILTTKICTTPSIFPLAINQSITKNEAAYFKQSWY